MPSIVNNKILKETKQWFESNPYAFISNIEGLTVADVSQLRRNLEKCSKRSLVVKHSLARKAFESLALNGVDKFFKGGILVTVGDKDPQQISKALVDFSKTNKKFVPRGVVFEKMVYDASFIKTLSELPSRHELLTQMVVRVKSPISGFVMTLNQLLKGLAIALNGIKAKKEAAAA